MNHIMLDLETLDTRHSAVVLSIGATSFDTESLKINDTFYVELTNDIAAQEKVYRTISGSTVKWWMQQDVMARRVFADPGENRVTTLEGLSRFKQFVDAYGKGVCIWGNGADFDNIILGTLYEDMGMSKPWSYGKNRCFRTLKNLGLPRNYVAPGKTGTAHNALDDAIYQTHCLLEIARCVPLSLG